MAKRTEAKTSVMEGRTLCVFRIDGIKPLLQHNPAGNLSRNQGPKAKTIPTAEDEAEKAAYRLPDGQLYVRSEAFFGSMVGSRGGAAGRKFGKVTAASRILAGCSFDIEEECPLFDPETEKPIKEYVIDVRRAVIQRNAILRARPRIEKWACYLSVEIDEQFITADQFLELLNISGQVAGVGDFRPQTRGRFGKFRAELHSRQGG